MFIGFSLSSSFAEENIVIGKSVNFSNLLIGSRYFLSESNGKISHTPPATKNRVVVQVGIAKSLTELVVLQQHIVIL